jgi:hypothetical protein
MRKILLPTDGVYQQCLTVFVGLHKQPVGAMGMYNIQHRVQSEIEDFE